MTPKLGVTLFQRGPRQANACTFNNRLFGKVIFCLKVYYFSGAVFYNKDFFKDPETFRPERFIDASREFVSDERVIYFGTGKRRCVGEILGRAEQYLFSVALIQVLSY